MTDDLHYQAEDYALGILEDHETPAFETHLSHCDDCREEVAAMRDLTARLSQAVATDPPPSLRSSVLSAIASVPQDAPTSLAKEAPASLAKEGPASLAKESPLSLAKEGPASLAKESPAARGRHAGPASTEPDLPDNVVPIRRSWGTRAAGLVAAASLVAAAAFGGWALNERNSAQDRADLAASQSAKLVQVLSANDVQTASSKSSTGGSATVVRSPSQGAAFLVGSELPALDDNQVYEAWTIDDQTPVPAGTFAAGDQGGFELPDAALDAHTVAVTVEPDGGSEAPTSDIIMAFSFDA